MVHVSHSCIILSGPLHCRMPECTKVLNLAMCSSSSVFMSLCFFFNAYDVFNTFLF